MKKKIIPIFLCLVLAFGFSLYGCGGDSFSKIKVEGKQDTSYTVYSNGGNAVQYGNYIYFINGYSGYEDTDGKQNVWPDVVKGGLYRAELCGEKNADKAGDFDIKQNAGAINKQLEFKTSSNKVIDEYGFEKDVVNVQLIAPKRIGTSGYKDGGIFIYDDWVYFASPNNEKNKAGAVQYNKTDFFRAKLDGSKSERIYTTENDSTSGAYAFYKYDGATYLVAQDGKDLVSIRIEEKKAGDKVTIAQNVDKVLLPYSQTYYKGMNENTLNHFVYVQRAVGDGDSQKTGNVIEIMRPDGSEGGVYLRQGRSDTLEAVRDGLLFYRTSDDAGNTLIKYDNLHNFLMGNEGDEKVFGDSEYKAEQTELAEKGDPNARSQVSGTILSTSNISDYKSIYCFRLGGDGNGNIVYMIGAKTESTELRSSVALSGGNDDSSNVITICNAGMTVLNVAGDYVYYTDSEGTIIFRTAWNKAASEKTEAELREQISHDDVTASTFNGDFCAGYIVYTGKADDLADGYAFFKLVERIEGTEKVFVGKKSDADTLAAPELSIDGNTISWNAVESATGYNVYRTVDGETEMLLKGTTDTSYAIADTMHGSYYVIAVSGNAVSAKSNVKNY